MIPYASGGRGLGRLVAGEGPGASPAGARYRSMKIGAENVLFPFSAVSRA